MSKKQTKPCISYFYLDPYPVIFGFADNEKDFQAELKRLEVKNQEGAKFTNGPGCATTHTLTGDGDPKIIVTISVHPNQTMWQTCGLLAHEAVHAWNLILKFIGEDNPGEEISAYNIQHMTAHMCRKVFEKRKIK